MRTALIAEPAAAPTTLDEHIFTLLGRLTDPNLLSAGVIPWSSPVPVFGNPQESIVATVGINPSNREFVDQAGNELESRERRFHTLRSLGLRSWSQAKFSHAVQVAEACRSYFSKNPYDTWFKALDRLIQGTNASFYPAPRKACHLDLIPFATAEKWTSLTTSQRNVLLRSSRTVLPALLSNSPIRLLVLNGATVVREVSNAFQIHLEPAAMRTWRLRRETGEHVPGIAYVGDISSIDGAELGRKIRVLGYNHNIQSSFGVTSLVRMEIARWIMNCAEGHS